MTHCDRVLALLSDGRPHDYMEGYRLGVMLHSRVADLRKRGLSIRCWREKDTYLYQLDLASLRGEDEPRTPYPGSGAGVPDRVESGPSSFPLSEDSAAYPPVLSMGASASRPGEAAVDANQLSFA